MAKRRDLEVTITAEGEVTVKIEGFPGKQCLKVRDILEQELGYLRSQRLTSEYYEPEEKVDLNLRNRHA